MSDHRQKADILAEIEYLNRVWLPVLNAQLRQAIERRRQLKASIESGECQPGENAGGRQW